MERNKLQNLFIDKNVGTILFDEPMKNHTSFKIGGPADVMIIPKSEEGLISAVKLCRENDIEMYIMGNGSNLLVRDGGMRGVVIKINEGLNIIKVEGNTIYSQAGSLITAVSRTAMAKSLTGFEFANGIPGSIGGAVTMNAGAYGGEMKDVIKSVRVLDGNNNIVEYTNEEMNFRYRGSKVVDENLIVLSIEIELKPGDHEEIQAVMKDLTEKRTSKQPLELPSAGSTFKRPTGYYAGKLIDDAGLRGLRYGGAQVSEKHCGFVVNIDNATCKEVLQLILVVQKTVRDKFGVELDTEIKIIGED
ncbi:UDP-N-acetylmuramate dehydrogenase [Tissierella sp. Yu-01]|uniref:UDP-N-acetylmuramate dehydrogenase n=1 Tax=Tissierella sp. Yu-01 TaxID=3035694 RepID=UPI00240E54BF|nr:UDP-N-acetylmuramate dehydrogenase [Tissierella sp. Yu-01]WFA09163.1 UDP-N-acetylmuramate dehydrogenase [Tissierella sp. Yu-01]